MDSLEQEQIEERYSALRRSVSHSRIRTSWVRFVRKSLQMKVKDLATRTSRSPAAISQIESRELDGAITLETMRRMADAMESDFVYFIVPRKTVQVTRSKRAFEKAQYLLQQSQVHMELEDQAVTASFVRKAQLLAKKLLEKGDIW